MKKIITVILLVVLISSCSNKNKDIFTKDNTIEIMTRERKFDTITKDYQFSSKQSFEIINEVALLKDKDSSSSIEVAFYKKDSINKDLSKTIKDETYKVFKENKVELNDDFNIKISNYRKVDIIKLNYSFSFVKVNNKVTRYFVPTAKGIVSITYTIVDEQDNYSSVVEQILKTIY